MEQSAMEGCCTLFLRSSVNDFSSSFLPAEATWLTRDRLEHEIFFTEVMNNNVHCQKLKKKIDIWEWNMIIPSCCMPSNHRRKKHAGALQSAGQRRSARLIALEEHKKGRAVLAVASMDVLRPSRDAQLISSRKQGRKKGVRIVYEGKAAEVANPSNDGNISNTPSALQKQIDYQIVEYILDMLEVKDTKELFSMPDEFQTSDYCERVSRPGDFATLRQKHKDGMYSTLEQFEVASLC